MKYLTAFTAMLLALAPQIHANPEPEEKHAGPAEDMVSLQRGFLDLKFGMFLHYNMASYKGVQWVEGYESPATFNPGVEAVDTDAWADAAVAAGMKYGVLTVKHVSGFCLWDSKYTTYDVMHPDCPYQKDLVAQFVESFKKRGLKVGLYYCWRSPGFADRYKVLPPECDPATHSMEQQIEFQKKQIAELLEKYPDVFYVWNDGLDPTIMPAEKAHAFFRETKSDVLFSGNWWDWSRKGEAYGDIAVTEMGHFKEDSSLVGETCWSLEAKWFWNEGYQPKPAAEIVDLVQIANSRGANLLLNVAPDREGKFEPESVKVLKEIGRIRDAAATAKKQISAPKK